MLLDGADKYPDVLASVFPVQIMDQETARESFPSLQHVAISYNQLLTPEGKLLTSGCNKIFKVDADSCLQPNWWCPFFAPNAMPLIQWQLRHWGMSSSCHAHEVRRDLHALHADAINVAWHVRTGDIVLHPLDDAGRPYYRNVHAFLTEALKGCRVHLNVISQKNVSEFLSDVVGNASFPTLGIQESLCTFMNSDIFISMGSSFGDMAAAFSQAYRPVVLQEPEKLAESMGGKGEFFFSLESIRLNRAGQVTDGTTPRQLRQMVFSAMFETSDFRRLKRACYIA